MKFLRKAEHYKNENGYHQLVELRDIIIKNTRKLSMRKKQVAFVTNGKADNFEQNMRIKTNFKNFSFHVELPA